MKNTIKKLWQDESAQGATEYILMLVVVVSIAMMFRGKIVKLIEGKTDELGSKINSFE